ncbi:hypothetical protein [Sphaerospermopsis aphanizomenoides]|uniref:hypothetical protein n=1 Tax=Sphaerospermopsis aphanizomenoides TaxID=459663 RepID=UPI001F2A6EA4|nr:hypothetical protein [Sphaerospermopsis aphanizomenoides]
MKNLPCHNPLYPIPDPDKSSCLSPELNPEMLCFWVGFFYTAFLQQQIEIIEFWILEICQPQLK